jgi:predicted nucleic acid-binding protein
MPKGKELKLVGADTGFFYSLKEGDQTAQAVFQDCDIVVSILTVFELRRAALKVIWHRNTSDRLSYSGEPTNGRV